MPNKARGDSELVAGNRHYTMRLTLGALAEIEDGLGLKSLGEIGARLKSLATNDIAIVVAALLKGGGHNILADEVMTLDADLGAIVRAIAGAFEAAGLGEARESVFARQNEARESVFAKRSASEGGMAANAESPLPGRASSPSASA